VDVCGIGIDVTKNNTLENKVTVIARISRFPMMSDTAFLAFLKDLFRLDIEITSNGGQLSL
jgi:hypothetical protein